MVNICYSNYLKQNYNVILTIQSYVLYLIACVTLLNEWQIIALAYTRIITNTGVMPCDAMLLWLLWLWCHYTGNFSGPKLWILWDNLFVDCNMIMSFITVCRSSVIFLSLSKDLSVLLIFSFCLIFYLVIFIIIFSSSSLLITMGLAVLDSWMYS